MPIEKKLSSKVSVCIPTYNYGHYIGDAIESVLTQDFEDFTLTIIDNLSSDDTRVVVDKFLNNDSPSTPDETTDDLATTDVGKGSRPTLPRKSEKDPSKVNNKPAMEMDFTR